MSPRKPRTSGTERAFQIIECFVELGKPATAYQVAKKLGAPLSTVYESIALLERLHILARQNGDGKYFLGFKLLLYGLAYSSNLEADKVYGRECNTLSKLTKLSVQVSVRDGAKMVVTLFVNGGDQFVLSSRPGRRLPLNWSASGILVFGRLPEEEKREVFQKFVPSPSGRAVMDYDKLCELSRQAWERGYCVWPVESDFAVTNISVPIINELDECRDTMGFIVPEHIADAHHAELAEKLQMTARRIEQLLGWRQTLENNSQFSGPENGDKSEEEEREELRAY